MNMKKIDGFSIIGISVRTTNKSNQAAQDLGKLWEKFYGENVFGKIPNKLNDDIYSIYTDYTSDYTEDYTAILGCQVDSLEDVPDKLIGREFASENFEVFLAQGKMPDAVVNSWIDIWHKDKELQRKYTYDFELYSKNSQKGDNSEVRVFIASNKLESAS